MGKGNGFCRVIYSCLTKPKKVLHRLFVEPVIKKSFFECGSSVRVPSKCSFSGISNITVGDHVSFGVDTRIMTTRAKVIIGRYVMFGPSVTIITGDHRTDILGKYMCLVTDSEKRPEDDMDVVIEDDVWIGANATVLKGVTIGKGSIVASGAVVTKSFPPYSIIGGVPAKLIKPRFTPEEIGKHEEMLKKDQI